MTDNYQKLQKEIMNLDPKTRMVTICDSAGKILLFSDHRPGVVSLLAIF
jgi:hypothetical protein